MKHILYLLLMPATFLMASDDDYTNYIRVEQTNYDGSASFYDISDLDSSGETTATEGISGTAIYRLYTIHNTEGEIHFLDEDSASSFLPSATLEIISEDPYIYADGSVKTRSDIPFQVKHTILNISATSQELRATTALYSRDTYTYDDLYDETFKATTAATTSTKKEISANGEQTVSYSTQLSSVTGDLSGKEVYTVNANTNPEILLDNKTIKVFPTSSGSFSGFDDDSVNIQTSVYAAVPAITIDVTNIYPGSELYLQYYAGANASNPAGATKIQDSYIKVSDTSTPYKNKFDQLGVDENFPDDGTYTIELVEVTPFSGSLKTIIHGYQTFTKEKIIINANLIGSE